MAETIENYAKNVKGKIKLFLSFLMNLLDKKGMTVMVSNRSGKSQG